MNKKVNKIDKNVYFVNGIDNVEIDLVHQDIKKIEQIIEIGEIDDDLIEEVDKKEICQLEIQPRHIRDYEIKKPEGKKPSLLKALAIKIKKSDSNSSLTDANKTSKDKKLERSNSNQSS